MTKLKIPSGVKIKNTSVECRVALRLIQYTSRHQTTAQVRTLAQEVKCLFSEAMRAVEVLAKSNVLSSFEPVSANEFKFVVDPEIAKAHQQTASGYDRHIVARQERAATRPMIPPHLKPIPAAVRIAFKNRGDELAKKLGVPRLGFKLANCLARIGEPEVVSLVEKAIETSKSATEKVSSVRVFFTSYSIRRDELIPKNSACQVG